jgi:phage head maturation protease
MTEEILLNQQYQVQAEIPLSFIRFFEGRTDERVLEVVLVYNGVDRFDTVIEPDGMKTDPKTVTVDYNHRGVATGAYLTDVRVVENYELEDGQVLERALVGNIHIPKDSEMFYFDKDGAKRSNGNLYETVSKGQIQSVSVEFKPYKNKQATDTKTGITTFREWDLIRLSLLDVTPGQPYSGIKIIRSLMQDNQPTETTKLSLDSIKLALENGDLSPEDVMALCEPARAETEIEITSEGEDKPEAEGEKAPETASEETPAPTDEEKPKEDERKEEDYNSREVITSLSERVDKMQETLDRLCGAMEKGSQRSAEDLETQTKIDELKARKIESMLETAPEKKAGEEGQPADNLRSLDSSSTQNNSAVKELKEIAETNQTLNYFN